MTHDPFWSDHFTACSAPCRSQLDPTITVPASFIPRAWLGPPPRSEGSVLKVAISVRFLSTLRVRLQSERGERADGDEEGRDALVHPFHDQTIAVTRCGRISFEGRKVNLQPRLCWPKRRSRDGFHSCLLGG